MATGLIVNGVISETGGARALTTSGAVTLANNNTYTGDTTVNSGTLTISGAASDAGSGGIAVGSNRWSSTTAPRLPMRCRWAAAPSATRPVPGTLNGAMTLTSDSFFESTGTGTGLTLTGGIGGPGGLTAQGGTLTLSADNAYAGGTTVSAGILALTATGHLADTGAVTVGTAGIFRLNGDETIGSVILSGTLDKTNAGDKLTAGSYQLNDHAVVNVALGRSALLGDGNGTLTSNGAVTLTNAVDSLVVNVAGGTLSMGAAHVFTAEPTVNVATGSATLDLQSHAQTLGALTGPGSVVLGSGTLSLGSAGDSTFRRHHRRQRRVRQAGRGHGHAQWREHLHRPHDRVCRHADAERPRAGGRRERHRCHRQRRRHADAGRRQHRAHRWRCWAPSTATAARC